MKVSAPLGEERRCFESHHGIHLERDRGGANRSQLALKVSGGWCVGWELVGRTAEISGDVFGLNRSAEALRA
jgi:hypothetical protein